MSAVGVCAWTPDALQISVWSGIHATYPGWVEKVIYQCVYEDENRYSNYIDPVTLASTELTEDWHVFMRNRRGRVRLVEMDLIIDYYKEINSHWVVEDARALDYYIYDSRNPYGPHPEWFEKALYEGWIGEYYGTLYFMNGDGEIACDPKAVFILDPKSGWVNYIEYDKFLLTTISPEGGGIHWLQEK